MLSAATVASPRLSEARSRHIDIHMDMLRHMRTTVRLDDALLDQARREAKRRGTTLTALIEQGLRLALRRPLKPPERAPFVLPECTAGGGVLPGVNLDDSAGLLDRMDRNA